MLGIRITRSERAEARSIRASPKIHCEGDNERNHLDNRGDGRDRAPSSTRAQEPGPGVRIRAARRERKRPPRPRGGACLRNWGDFVSTDIPRVLGRPARSFESFAREIYQAALDRVET